MADHNQVAGCWVYAARARVYEDGLDLLFTERLPERTEFIDHCPIGWDALVIRQQRLWKRDKSGLAHFRAIVRRDMPDRNALHWPALNNLLDRSEEVRARSCQRIVSVLRGWMS